jgi:integrase
MGKQRRKRGNYAERKNKDGSVSRFSIPTIRGKPKWVKIPNLPEYEGKRGARRHLDWCREKYGGDWATETFAQAAAAHLKFIEGGKYGTYRIREQAIRLHLVPYFGRKRIAEIKRADVQNFIRDKTATLSARYVRLNLVAALRAILQIYVADDRLPRNAASGSPAFQYPPAKKAPKKLDGTITTKVSADGRTLIDGGRALTSEEVTLLLTHSSAQYWALLLTLVYTGMRLGEVLAMQWRYLSDRKGGGGTYAVEYNLDKRGNLDEVKTTSSRAEIALSTVVVDALREQRAKVAQAKLVAGKDWTDLDLVFPRMGNCQHWGNPQSPGNIRDRLMRAARRAGIGHVRPHDLRHTCASLLIAQDINIKQVSSHLRHSSVGVTLDTYGHLYPADRDKVVNAMDRVLGVAENG